ncbi:O-methyltransferase-domain-containing protein [Chaetomium fimeti]|uniref:O-methyltransferase-domain-containing protein n=1 Tax=Chaetomium fimeti TaxID=1854472 RepID=A0AAE0HKH1_9PEZI|nr:O-methyltransferase-domain-containing protein [Chaetomium fimeti]
MSVPQSCTVLVVGGGPAGSFASAALAREGIDVVMLEADKHPRYHIGESMLPSMRHFLDFIDCYDKFNSHGFIKKKGAAFRLNPSQPEAYTDFIAAGGPNGHAWNVVRSEADELLFNHAASCGARTFDATKVDAVQFEEGDGKKSNPGKPVSASWKRKDGTSGTIAFKHIVDASGRYGLLSTKYLKNRKFNQNLKNIANWAYWKGGGTYGTGTHKAGSPFFEALQDASGWCWFIPLHDGTHSIGIVQNQQMATDKKRAAGSPSTKEFYMQSLQHVPGIRELLSKAELVSDVKSASDWSYSADSYAFPYARIVGDAGCFIDPYFSSGVHLAVMGGISAAVTIAASLRGDCDEKAAASWHSKKTAESYTRFYLVVSSALKQIRMQDDPVIQDIDEEGFQRAFDLFRPVIQGTVDADPTGKLSQNEVATTVEFCFKAFSHVTPEQKEAVVNKLKSLGVTGQEADNDDAIVKVLGEIEKNLTLEEAQVLDILRSRRMIREDGFNMDSFTLDAIDGLAPRMERGNLGLAKAEMAKLNGSHMYSVDFLEGKRPGFRAQEPTNGMNGHTNGHTNGHEQHEEPSTMNGTTKATSSASNGSINGMNGNSSSHDILKGDSERVAGGIFAPPINGHASLLDDVGRHAVMSTLHEAAENLETPFDLVMRLGNTARLLTFIRVGIELNIFTTLTTAAAPGILTVHDLAAASPTSTNTDPTLVRRVLRYLAANRMVTESGPDRYSASKSTRFLADPGIAGGATFFQGVVAPATHHLPDSPLAQNGFAAAAADAAGGDDAPPLVFHSWAATDLDLYPWLKTQPRLLSAFQNLMTVDRGGDWIGCVDFSSSASGDDGDGDGERTVFVDVGGNVGHQTRRLVAAHPALAGRVVVQDLPETVAAAPAVEGVEFVAHDFFKPQPVRGARFYYLRSILHNWGDERAVEILRGLVPALAADSRVLIDELVVPDQGADAWVAGQDLNMMLLFGGMERRRDDWTALLDRAGLKMVDIKTYAPVRRSSIIVAMLK